MKKANSGDEKALAELRDVLDRNPLIWQRLGNLHDLAEQAWITLLSDGNAALAESIRRTAAQMREALVGDSPTQLETLMAAEVVATHLELKYSTERSARDESGSLGHAAMRLKRLESAQKRYHAAMKNLVMMRNLETRGIAPPPLRVFREPKQA